MQSFDIIREIVVECKLCEIDIRTGRSLPIKFGYLYVRIYLTADVKYQPSFCVAFSNLQFGLLVQLIYCFQFHLRMRV